jgi:predicted permease
MPWSLALLESVHRDMRYAVRSLLRSPVFTAVAVVSLALGIGANAAIFTVLNAVVLRPFQYADADRLVVIHEAVREIRLAPRLPVNAAHVEEWRQRARGLEQIAMLRDLNVTLTGTGEPERLTMGRVSASLFPMLGVRPPLGRVFLDEEDRAGRDQVVVLSYELWQRRFGSSSDIIGRRLVLDDQPYTVVGVLPRDFRLPRLSDVYPISIASTSPQLWKPFGLRDDERVPIGDFNYGCIAKLRPGISATAASAELASIQSDIDTRLTRRVGLGAAIVPLADQVTSRVRTAVWLLQAASGIVLLIVCVNVASLVIGRTAARRRELAVRKAIGATSRHLVTQMLIECSLLGGAAAVAAVLLAAATVRFFDARAPVDLPRVNDIRLDPAVGAFVILITMMTTALIGLAAAWRSIRVDTTETMRESTRTTSAGRVALATRSILVATQVALSAISLVAAGLLLHSLANVMRVDKGFDAAGVVAADLTLPPIRYPDLVSTTAFVRSLLTQLSPQPGVISAGVVSQPPLAGAGGNNNLLPEGELSTQPPIVDFRPTNRGYFETMSIPLHSGRLFDDTDGQRPVAVVSAMAARRGWPGQDPIGKRFRLGSPQGRLIEVIGVVGDIHGVSLSDEPTPTVYLPYWQRSFNRNRLYVVVKTSGEAATAAPIVRRAVSQSDSAIAVSEVRTMQAVVEGSTAARRFQASLLLLFGAAALVLTILGTYAMLSYAVVARTTEIGIRLALGEPRGRVLGHVLRDAAWLVAAGLAIGLPTALAAGVAMRGLLFAVVPYDALTFAATTAVLVVTALVAALGPAWRASRVDPMITLRSAA